MGVEGKESDLGLEEETLRNRNGPEVERGLEGKDEGECQGKDGDGDQRRKECWLGETEARGDRGLDAGPGARRRVKSGRVFRGG